MSVKFSNNAKTTLSSSISSSATSIAVADASVFPSISGSEYFYVTFEDLSGNVEIVKVTGVSSNTLTVTRGQESTTARSFSSGDKAENRLTAGGLNDVATQADTDTNTTYSAGSGLSLSGTTFSNTAPDQTVSLSGSGATSVSGTYPNFTVSSTDTNTTYLVGDGGLTQNNFTNALKSKLDAIEASADVTDTANVVSALTAGSNVTIASDGTISSTDTNTDTTYSAGSGISLSGTTFSNSAPDQTVSLTGSGATSISGTYPNFTITSTDTNTTYTVGDGGLTQNNFTNALKSKLDGIEASADVTDTANVVGALTAGTNVTIASDGTISASGGVDGISSAATSNAMHIDSAGRIGFGTNNPSAWYYDDFVFTSGNAETSITIAGTNATGGSSQILFSDGSGSGSSSYTGFIKYGHNVSAGGSGPSLTTDWMALGVNAQQRVRIDNAGNVGIGNDYSPSEKLDVNGTVRATSYKIGSDQGNDGDVLTSTGSGVAWEAPAGPTGFSSSGDDVTISADADNNAGNSAIKFEIDGSEFARFSTQNDDAFVIGHTTVENQSAFGGTEKTQIRKGDGAISVSTDDLGAIFAKTTGHTNSMTGAVMEFRRSNSTVGTIGVTPTFWTNDSGLYLGGGPSQTDTGIRLDGIWKSVMPADGTDGTKTTNTTDLGFSDARWKDFYLGNDILHLDSGGTARTLYDRSADTLGNSSTNVTAATVDGTNFKVNGAQGSDGQVLTSTGSGVAWEDSGNNSFIVNTFTANGSTTAFTLSTSPSSESNLMVFIEGVYQNPSDFTLSGTTLTLDAAPPSGRKIVAYQVTEIEMDVISDNAVGISQLNVSDGTSGQVLQTDGSGTLSFGDVGSLPPNIAGVSSGRYYSGMMHAKAASSFNLSTTSVQYWPFIVPEDCTIDELTVIINGGTGNSGDVAQIAVYGPMPSTVGSTPHKITTSTFAVDSGYGKSVAITATSFTAGIYFFAMVANTSSLSVRAFEDMEEHINYMVGVNNYSFNGGLGGSQNAVNTVSTWPHTFLTSVSPSAATHSFGNRPQFKYGVQ